MFILSLTYIKTVSEVEKYLSNHIVFLEKYYKAKKFICSGRKIPRTGGIILCNSNSLKEVNAIISEDPLYKEKVADYEIIEFIPTKFVENFEPFI